MRKIIFLSFLILLSTELSGCSTLAPQYTSSLENVQKLKDGGIAETKVGKIGSSSDPHNANPISLRASSLHSPYEDSYAVYLAEAIKQELTLAGKINPNSNIEISGVLLKNDIDASGLSTATGDMQAKFVVTKDGKVVYSQVKTIHHEWDSSVLGAIAIPRAQQEYPRIVQLLLAALYSDPDFLQALK